MKENNIIASCLFIMLIISSLGWYIAEMDNEVLRQELSLYTGKEIRK